MSTITALMNVIDGPLPVAAPYGLAETIGNIGGLIDEADDHWMNGLRVDSQICGPAVFISEWPCVTDPPSPPEDKDAGEYPPSFDWQSFATYAPITCSSLGQTDGARLRERAAAFLNATDSTGMEAALEFGVGDNKFLTDTDLVTVSGATGDIVSAFAALEQAAADNGARGGAVIHMPPIAAAVAARYNLIVRDGRILRSVSSWYPVVVGQGYTGDGGEGNVNIYITGPVQIRRSAVFMVPDNPAAALDRETNVYEFRAERIVNVLFDACLQAAATVDLSLTDTGT